MQSKICEILDIEFPLLAFSHCRDVVVAVSKAGGMGVFGAVNLPPDRLEEELNWIDDHIDGKPYGIDLIVPNKYEGKGKEVKSEDIIRAVPQEHKTFANSILESHDIEVEETDEVRKGTIQFGRNLSEKGAETTLEVAMKHPIKLIANALGVPPKIMLDLGKKHNIAVAALVGAKEHAIKQVEAGVDILVVAGGEAGGHCGDVSTMVLIPEVYNAVKKIKDVPILAAGGITTGSQMAAAMTMGADGAWCGSVWLTTSEAETNPVVKEKMLAASSRDTVRSRSRTGKLLPLKTGMFSMIIHSYLRDPKKPIAFVPIYIGSDKVFELGSYLKELSGAAKQKESLFQFLQSWKILKQYFGKAYVSYGEPLKLDRFLDAAKPDWREQAGELQKPEWMSEVDKHAQENISRILVGNKKDLEDQRQVPYNEAKDLADHFNVRFLETSAKNAQNVEDAFTLMTREIKSKVATSAPKRPTHDNSTKISKGNTRKLAQKNFLQTPRVIELSCF